MESLCSKHSSSMRDSKRAVSEDLTTYGRSYSESSRNALTVRYDCSLKLDMDPTAFVADTYAAITGMCVLSVVDSYLTMAIGVKSGMLQTVMEFLRLCTTHMENVGTRQAR